MRQPVVMAARAFEPVPFGILGNIRGVWVSLTNQGLHTAYAACSSLHSICVRALPCLVVKDYDAAQVWRT